MILVDANIFMYAGGKEHPCKAPCVEFLRRVAAGALRAAMNAETLQEILHRYRALERWEDGKRVYDQARLIVPDVMPVTAAHMDAARKLLDAYSRLTARDALHAAVCLALESATLCSYDRDFDAIAGVTRHEPAHYLKA